MAEKTRLPAVASHADEKYASADGDVVTVFRNCSVLRNHRIVVEDLWTQDGKIIDPADLFFYKGRTFDRQVNCKGALLAPGLIDLQINGGFGVDFSYDIVDETSAERCLRKVGKGILAHGVTSFLPTVVTSAPETYHKILPYLGPKRGGRDVGANRLGAHLEGPFISPAKKGAHKPEFIREMPHGFLDVKAVYGPSFEKCTTLVTLAPELDPEASVVAACAARGVSVSVGHSAATLAEGESAVRWGATLITHLFNAMTSFHHRDPGLLGLLTSTKLAGQPVFYGLIADGIHTHPAAVRIAYRTNFESMCLVTDAVCALGLADGEYQLGCMPIVVEGERAYVAGTSTLCGAIVDLFKAVKKTMHFARCTLVEALEAASLHPAQALGMDKVKGTLDFGADADFVMIDTDNMEVLSTWIAGKCVYRADEENTQK